MDCQRGSLFQRVAASLAAPSRRSEEIREEQTVLMSS